MSNPLLFHAPPFSFSFFIYLAIIRSEHYKLNLSKKKYIYIYIYIQFGYKLNCNLGLQHTKKDDMCPYHTQYCIAHDKHTYHLPIMG